LDPHAPIAPRIINDSAMYLSHIRLEIRLATRSVAMPIKINATVKWSTNGWSCHVLAAAIIDSIKVLLSPEIGGSAPYRESRLADFLTSVSERG
jgi:hypothetical protein